MSAFWAETLSTAVIDLSGRARRGRRPALETALADQAVGQLWRPDPGLYWHRLSAQLCADLLLRGSVRSPNSCSFEDRIWRPYRCNRRRAWRHEPIAGIASPSDLRPTDGARGSKTLMAGQFPGTLIKRYSGQVRFNGNVPLPAL
jgi:hypothetical protein